MVWDKRIGHQQPVPSCGHKGQRLDAPMSEKPGRICYTVEPYGLPMSTPSMSHPASQLPSSSFQRNWSHMDMAGAWRSNTWLILDAVETKAELEPVTRMAPEAPGRSVAPETGHLRR